MKYEEKKEKMMKLYEAEGQKVRIILKDGAVFEGVAYDYISALDNEPEPESITIDSIEIYAPEIKKIEKLDENDQMNRECRFNK